MRYFTCVSALETKYITKERRLWVTYHYEFTHHWYLLGHNLALQRPTFSNSNKSAPFKAVDGQNSTGLKSCFSSDTDIKNPFWAVDLQRHAWITHVTLTSILSTGKAIVAYYGSTRFSYLIWNLAWILIVYYHDRYAIWRVFLDLTIVEFFDFLSAEVACHNTYSRKK